QPSESAQKHEPSATQRPVGIGPATSEEKTPRLRKHLLVLYEAYFRSLWETCDDYQKRILKAYWDYVRALQDAFLQDDAERRVRDAYLAYVKAADDLRSQYEKRVHESFRTYIHGLKESLEQTDVAAVDPASLA